MQISIHDLLATIPVKYPDPSKRRDGRYITQQGSKEAPTVEREEVTMHYGQTVIESLNFIALHKNLWNHDWTIQH